MTYMHSKVHGKCFNTSTIAKKTLYNFLPPFEHTKPSSMLTGQGVVCIVAGYEWGANEKIGFAIDN